MKITRLQNIHHATLEHVSGGVQWGQALNQGFDWARKGTTIGATAGAAVGTAVPAVGTLTGLGAGGLAGTAAGFGAGVAKGVWDTWGK